MKMPMRRYAKARRTTRKSTYRKRATLAPKNIKRRTGARAQSKQIASLSRKVNVLTRSNFETFSTQWTRLNLPIETATGPGTPYVCPIVQNPCAPFAQSLATADVAQWRDSLAIAAQPRFEKNQCFTASKAAQESPCLYHKGTTIKWQMFCNEPRTTKVAIMVVSPKKGVATQIIADNQLNIGPVPFGPRDGNVNFALGTDYVLHPGTGSSLAPDTTFGVLVNLKRWDVHYKTERTFGVPLLGADGESIVQTTIPDGANNSNTACGTIKLPGIGKIVSVSKADTGDALSRACQLGIVDQKAHSMKYLVCITNGVVSDSESVTLGMNVLDTYKATV